MKKFIKRAKVVHVLIAILFCVASVAISSDEITLTGLLKIVNGNFNLTRTVSNYKVDQTGTAVDYGIQSVAIGATNNLNINNVSTPGYVWLRNLSTNDVYVTCVIKLRNGNFALLPVSTTNMTTYTTSGTNDLEYWINQE